MDDVDSQALFDSLEEFVVRLFSLSETEGIDNLSDLDLSFSQARILFCLACVQGSLPINEIADAIKLSVASAGRNVDRLVKLGLAERRESSDDRRVKLVSLTSAGEEVAYAHLAAKRQAIRVFTDRLPADERSRLFHALTPILAGDNLRPTSQEIHV